MARWRSPGSIALANLPGVPLREGNARFQARVSTVAVFQVFQQAAQEALATLRRVDLCGLEPILIFDTERAA